MPSSVRRSRTVLLSGLAALLVIVGGAVALRASATTALGRDVVEIIAWDAQPDDTVVAILSDIAGARDRSEVVVLDADTGEETGRVVTGPSPHVAVDRANGRIHLAFESLAPSGQVTGVGVSLDADRGRVVVADTLPAPWGTPTGLARPGLFASADGEFLVYAHFVRRMDSRGEQTRNAAAFSVLDADRLTVVDTLELDDCAAGALSGPPRAGVVTLVCSDDAAPVTVVTVRASADGFDRGTLARVPTPEGRNAPLVAAGAEDASDVVEALANAAAAVRRGDDAPVLFEAATTTSEAYYVSLRGSATGALAGAGLYRVDRASGALTAAADVRVRSVAPISDRVLVVAVEGSDTLTTLDARTLARLQRWTVDTGGTPVEYVTTGR